MKKRQKNTKSRRSSFAQREYFTSTDREIEVNERENEEAVSRNGITTDRTVSSRSLRCMYTAKQDCTAVFSQTQH